MMIWDTFLFHDELDMLECRLTELGDVVDRFVICEGEITNLNEPKPSHYLDNRERFEAWEDKIVHVWATDLPPGGWDCEYQKREWIREGLGDAADDDLVLLSDVDEIPNPENLRGLETDCFVRFEHRLYCFAVDWLHPKPWIGTIAAPFGLIGSIQHMRELRQPGHDALPSISDNWHFTWMGGTEQNLRKLNSSHDPECQGTEIRAGLEDGNRFAREGVYIGGIELIPVDVDETWPRWIRERNCPDAWFREHHGGAV